MLVRSLSYSLTQADRAQLTTHGLHFTLEPSMLLHIRSFHQNSRIPSSYMHPTCNSGTFRVKQMPETRGCAGCRCSFHQQRLHRSDSMRRRFTFGTWGMRMALTTNGCHCLPFACDSHVAGVERHVLKARARDNLG